MAAPHETIQAGRRAPPGSRPGDLRVRLALWNRSAWKGLRAAAPDRTSWRHRAVARIGGWRLFASARGRILSWSLLLLAGAMAVSTVATHQFLVSSMNKQISNELKHEIAEFETVAVRYGATSSLESPEDRTSSTPPHPATMLSVLQVRTGVAVLEPDTVLLGVIDGKIATTSRNFRAALGPPPSVLARWTALTTPAAGTVTMAAGPARYQAVPVRIPGTRTRGVFVAAVLTSKQQAAIGSVTRLQVEVGIVALLAGALLAWLAAGRVLRPVRATTELAQQITESDLSARIPAPGRGEVAMLAAAFNQMLDRLEAAMTAQQRFLADAGHELRTPITIIQGNLDTLAPSDPEDAETLAIVADEITRMSRMVEELLLLADSERPDFLRPEPTDLAQLTRSLAAKARALDGGREWVLTGTAEGTAVLDPQRITQAVMQLAANAARHTPAGSPVEISSAADDGQVTFTIADHGPGIPDHARTRVFGRFARIDPRRTDGSGLGLAIVAAICAAHGGSVHAGGRGDGSQGASFTLTIPCRLAETAIGRAHQPAG